MVVTIDQSPTIISSSNLTAFNACSGYVSAVQSFTLGGAYLTHNMSIAAPSGYELSTDQNSWNNSFIHMQ